MIQFEYKDFSDRLSTYATDYKTIIQSIKVEAAQTVIEQLLSEIESLQKRTDLEIAFVGQYSAGKSTIIYALTGDKSIPIGQDITTDVAKVYPWNNVLLVDTPGINAGRPDHDQKTLKYIDRAQLLVYVLTVNGFDDVIGANFRKLAFDEQRIGKMMLVANKRSMESEENSAQWVTDIESVIFPSTGNDVYLSIIDAEEYIHALEEEDEGIKKELVHLSYFDDFISKLNQFVAAKGVLGQLIAPMNAMKTGLNHIINLLTADDEDTLKVQEALRQKYFMVSSAREKILRDVNSEIKNLAVAIKDKGAHVASQIVDSADIELLENENSDTIAEIEALCDKSGLGIQRIVTAELSNLGDELDNFVNSPLMQDILKTAKVKIDYSIQMKDVRIDERIKAMPEVVGRIGKILHGQSLGPEAAVKGLRAVSGSNLHEAILKVGEMVSFKFKPYQAVKLAEKIGKIGKFLGAAQVVLGPAIAIVEEVQEKKYKEEIKKSRRAIRHKYYEMAEEIVESYNLNIVTKIDEFLLSLLSDIDVDGEKLRSKKSLENATVKELTSLEKKVDMLLTEITEVRTV